MERRIQITENDIKDMTMECLRRLNALNEDMTRAQVENQIEDFMKTKEFEKRVHNIAVDVAAEFIENMWMKKSFWKTMVRKK